MCHREVLELAASLPAWVRIRDGENKNILMACFQGGETALASRVLSLLALYVWWEDYLGEGRLY